MILRGVFVALVMGIAHGAVPLTSREIQMREQMATVTTKFRAGKEAVKLHVASACPVRLVFQLPEYLSPPRIANPTGQRVILHHIRNGQPFHDDHLVLVYRLGGEVVKMVLAGITDFGVNFGDFDPRLLAIVRAFHFSRKPSLTNFQAALFALEMARILKVLSIAQSGERDQSNIKADLSADFRQWLDVCLDQDADEIAFGSVFADCAGNQMGIVREWARPRDIERLDVLGQRQNLPVEGEGILGIPDGLARVTALESRILRPLVKEVGETNAQVSQRLLKNDRTYFSEKGFLRFQRRQHIRQVNVAQRFLSLLPSFGFLLQSPVVDKSRAAKCFRQLLFLFNRWIEPIFVCTLFNHEVI